MVKIRAGIRGGSGYAAGELMRILLNHPVTDIQFVHSQSQASKYVSDIHTDLLGETDLKFSSTWSDDINVLFLCQGHGQSEKFLSENGIPARIKVIDIGSDFRLGDQERYGRKFIYGLPEWNRKEIAQANSIANPGCFATGIELALLPLAAHHLLLSDVHIHAITGSTGSGQNPNVTTHFSWRDSNLSVYKPFRHQHLGEIRQLIIKAQPSFKHALNFIPVRGNFTRGIFSTLYVKCPVEECEIKDIYQKFYALHPFIYISETNPHLKQVVNTNKALLYLQKEDDYLLIISLIDNLLKGAVGQAVQNMNLMFGVEETTGLRFKANAF